MLGHTYWHLKRHPPGGGTPGDQLSTEVIFETLSSRRRRYTLQYLSQVDESVTIRDLSEQVAAWENCIECRAVTPKQRKRVYTALHQTHLPKMDLLGVIVYDRDRGTITATDHLGAFDIYLDAVTQDDIPWGRFYLSLGGVSLALSVVAVVGFPPFSYVDGFGYALLIAVALTVTGCAHTLRDHRSLAGSKTASPDVKAPAELSEEESD